MPEWVGLCGRDGGLALTGFEFCSGLIGSVACVYERGSGEGNPAPSQAGRVRFPEPLQLGSSVLGAFWR